MRCLIILMAMTAVVSGHREATPGFAVDFRNFGGSRLYHDLPNREQPRSFRETGPAPGQHQTYRPESFRDYRPSFNTRDEGRNFRDDGRGGFKDEDRVGFKEELRTYSDEARPFRDETRLFKDEGRGFREDLRSFRDERIFRDDARGMREGPRTFREERPFREESRPFREEIRHFREGSYRDEPRPFREEIRNFEGARHFREDIRPFRNDVRPFREESTGFREDRPFREESGPLRNEPRPFREESGPFKDEILFTQESQTLAEAQHRFNKEQQHRQPLSFGGHSNYLKYGNHGLGYASIPSAILPLEDHPPRISSSMMIPDLSTTASTQAPNFLKHGIQGSSPPSESTITASHIAVTRAPDVGSTPSQSQSGNTISHSTNQQQTNENLVDGGATNPTSSGVTIPTSVGTSVTPKMLFTSGGPAMSNSPMGINGVDADIGVQQAHGASSNSLHASKQEINGAASQSSYFPSDTRPEVPQALLNYVFKYQVPEDAKVRYTFRNSLQPESFNQIQAVPLIHQHHHQTTKYTVLPELKISGLSAMQPGPSVNYVSSPAMSKVSYLSPNSQGLEISGGYTSGNVSPVNFAGNMIHQLDRDPRFTSLGQADQMTGVQANQYSQLGQINSNQYLTQLGQYGNLAQTQTSGVPFAQGGLPLQLGGFSGIDYNSLSSNSEASRVSSPMSLELTDSSRPAGSAFTKLSFGEPIWRL